MQENGQHVGPEPVGSPARPQLGAPRPDPIFGPECTVRDILLGADDEGPLTAALLHWERTDRTDDSLPPLLLMHGWSDYILDRDLIAHLASLGHDVWGLDLRKYGRALHEGQTATEIEHLSAYDAEIGAALAAIGPDRPPVLIAHSTGGLTAVLYAHRHPGAIWAIALNSPWLEMHVGALARRILEPLISRAAERLGARPILPRGSDHYARTLHISRGGLYDYDETLKPAGGVRFPADTLAAVLDGQRRLADCGPLGIPVLVLHSQRSRIGLRFTESMARADVILDVRSMVRRARRLGPQVRLEAIDGARHDVFLSDPEVRQDALARLEDWLAEISRADLPTMGAAEPG